MIAIPARLLRTILIGVCAASATLVAAEAFFLMPSSGGIHAAGEHEATEDIAGLMPDDIDGSISTILERSLFSPMRESVVPKEADDSGNDASAQIDQRLAGIAIGLGEREALFQQDGEKPIAVKLGGKISGWTVSAIEDDRVTLKGSNGEQTLRLTDSKSPGQKPIPRKPKPARPPAKPAAAPAAANQKPGTQNRSSVAANGRQAAR